MAVKGQRFEAVASIEHTAPKGRRAEGHRTKRGLVQNLICCIRDVNVLQDHARTVLSDDINEKFYVFDGLSHSLFWNLIVTPCT
jgi:hypothetical protein